MKVAALDVGSNTVLMLVVECHSEEKPRVLADMSRITRLGRGVDAYGKLDPESAARTLDTVVEFTEKARSLGAQKILGAATAALRDAADGVGFLSEVNRHTGLSLEIISGETEAHLSYLSTKQGLGISPFQSLLILDIGGGSTELIRAQPGTALEVVSLQIGSVRLTERVIHSDPPAIAETEKLRAVVEDKLTKLGWSYRPATLVGIAGTVTTLCAISLGIERYSAESIHGQRLGRAEIARLIQMLGSMPLEARKRLPGMEPGRADVLFAGAMILERVMNFFGCAEVIVSDQGVRWGLIWRELARKTESNEQE